MNKNNKYASIQNTIVYIVLFIIICLPIYSVAQSCHGFLAYGIPGKSDQFLCREGYSVGYSYRYKQALWVAYKLTTQSVNNRIKRRDNFKPDREIPKRYRANLADYVRSKYDKGHLAPYAAMDFNGKSADQSFLLSNMSPQKPGLNRQAWAQLESYVRFWGGYKSIVYVYTGPIMGGNPKTIGRGVAVPNNFYKIIYAPKQQEAIAFEMPNKRISKKKVSDYRVSIKLIENQTGLMFLSGLSGNTRQRLVNNTSKMWRTSLSKKNERKWRHSR